MLRTVRVRDDHDPCIALLVQMVRVSVSDVRQAKSERVRREALQFLTEFVPTIAERLVQELEHE